MTELREIKPLYRKVNTCTRNVSHRSGGDFRYDRNTNSGAANNFTDDQFTVATNTIYHDAEHPSHIVLPLMSLEP